MVGISIIIYVVLGIVCSIVTVKEIFKNTSAGNITQACDEIAAGKESGSIKLKMLKDRVQKRLGIMFRICQVIFAPVTLAIAIIGAIWMFVATRTYRK